MSLIAQTPEPPYYVVIFTSLKTDANTGYDSMAEKMIHLAQKQEGFLGVEGARNDVGITVSYWSSLDAINKWKEHSAHQIAQEKGKNKWYTSFKVRIAKVEKDYGFSK